MLPKPDGPIADDVLDDGTVEDVDEELGVLVDEPPRRLVAAVNAAVRPVETLLVVDGTTGQNAISQARLFNETTELTGVIITKLDSTAKGGVLVAIVDTLEIPIKFVGLGEQADDLRPFSPEEFLDAVFEE